MLKFLIKRITDTAKLPNKAHPHDAGLDIYADSIKKVYMHGGGNGERILENSSLNTNGRVENGVLTLSYLERALVGTGLKMSIPEGYECQIRPRSGLALEKGITVLNSPGTIDCVPRGTKIATRNGTINVEDIFDSDGQIEIISFNEELFKIETDIVSDIWKVDDLELLEIKTETDTVTIPKDKLLYTKRGWIAANSLTTDDEILSLSVE